MARLVFFRPNPRIPFSQVSYLSEFGQRTLSSSALLFSLGLNGWRPNEYVLENEISFFQTFATPSSKLAISHDKEKRSTVRGTLSVSNSIFCLDHMLDQCVLCPLRHQVDPQLQNASSLSFIIANVRHPSPTVLLLELVCFPLHLITAEQYVRAAQCVSAGLLRGENTQKFGGDDNTLLQSD